MANQRNTKEHLVYVYIQGTASRKSAGILSRLDNQSKAGTLRIADPLSVTHLHGL